MAELKFKPIGDQLLVKPEDPETKTKSGLVLTEDSVEKPKSGKVVKLGTYDGLIMLDNKPFQFTVKVGSKVYWSGFGGNEIEIDGVKYLVMRESQLLGFDE